MKSSLLFTLIVILGFRAVSEESSTIQEAKDQITNMEMTQRRVMSSLYAINENLKHMVHRQGRLTEQILSAQADVHDLQASTNELQSKVKNLSQEVRAQIRNMYLLSGQSIARATFSAQSSVELERMLRYSSRIARAELASLVNFQRSLKALSVKKRQFARELKRLEKLRQRLLSSEKLLLREQEKKSHLLASIRDEHHATASRFEAMKSQMTAEQARLFENSFFEKRGQLQVPVTGELLLGFGTIEDRRFGARVPFRGWFIRTVQGGRVKAIHPGTIAFSGKVPGMGVTVVIDHGDHYYSVYGNLSSTKILAGDSVKADDQVGVVGFSGLDSAHGLYFEIRHFSEAVNPTAWIREPDWRTTAREEL